MRKFFFKSIYFTGMLILIFFTFASEKGFTL